MQLNAMDCVGRSNMNERDSEMGDDMSHNGHSDDEMRDCDSVERHHITGVGPRLKICSNNGTTGAGGANGSDHPSDMAMGHRQFHTNHTLSTLGSFMGIGSLHGIPNLPHNDILEKLQMQVRDINAGLMDQAHSAVFGSNVLTTPINATFALPPTTMASFTHAAHTLAVQAGNNLNSHLNLSSSLTSAGGLQNDSHNNFSFTSPTAPSSKDVNPASNSSTSSDTSSSSQHNNGWSFEEQYKQVRQLYEINDDPKRKEFLDDLFAFMQKRGTPINRLPIMAKSVLDLYELYNLVIARGGLVDVINKKLWQEIIKGLHLPSSITSAAFTLRTQYMKYLYPYECEKKNLSSPAELQAAIDGNRREGRRSSYGQYEAMHNQMQMPQMSRQSLPGSIQQISPLALVTHAANNQQVQAAAVAAAAHQRLMAPSFGQVSNLMPQGLEQRMIEYLKLIQVKKEQNAIINGSSTSGGLSPHTQHHQQQRQRSQSPEISSREALNALEMSRVALWQIYNSNTSPTASVNTPPQDGGNVNRGGSYDSVSESHRDGLNLSDLATNMNTVKREREREPTPEITEHNELLHEPPPAKRTGFPASFYLPTGIGIMNTDGSATTYQYKDDHHTSDTEIDDNDNDEHNRTAHSSHTDPKERQGLSNSSFRADKHLDNNRSVHNDKSDDSAIENSPTTSATSAGNGHVSPVSTKTTHLSKQPQSPNNTTKANNSGIACADNLETNNSTSLNQFETLNLLSGMQFRLTRHGSSSTGEQELAVNLELNGIKYSGVLVSNTQKLPMSIAKSTESTVLRKIVPPKDDICFSNKNATISHTSKSNSAHCINNGTNNNKSSKETIGDLFVAMDAIKGTTEMGMRDTETLQKTSPATSHFNANSPNSSANVLKDPLITS